MVTSVCLAFLFGVSPIEDSIVVRLEFDHNEYRVGDVAFGRVTMENTGKNACERMPTSFSSLLSTADYQLHPDKYPYSFRFVYAHSASGGKFPLTMQAGDKWIVDYTLLVLPEAKYFGDDFWADAIDRSCKIEFAVVEPSRFVLRGTSRLVLRGRPETEMDFLRKLFKEDRSYLADYDRPIVSSFGLTGFPAYEDAVERLLAFEEQLSPSTLRNVVKTTRLMRVLFAPKDAQTRDATVMELLQWLDTLPTIERHATAILLWRSLRNPKFGLRAGTRYADLRRGVILRMPERAFGQPTFREDHLERVEVLLNRCASDGESSP